MRGSGTRPTRWACGGLAVFVAVASLAIGSAAAGADPGKRIVGGNPANPADWPFAAAVFDHHFFLCSGSVIAPDVVLTAGHCLMSGFTNDLKVVVGRSDLEDHSTGERIRVVRGKVDPHYAAHFHEDFSVLRLEHPTSVAPVALPASPKDARAATVVGTRLGTAGWGATHPNGSGDTSVLMEAETTTIPPHECREAHPRWEPRSEICTRGDALSGGGDVSACYGDSGGPLVADTPGGVILVGATSYGGRRCGVRKPTVYARVGHALTFIRRAAGL
jgi:secreted trypsin-like serine protease